MTFDSNFNITPLKCNLLPLSLYYYIFVRYYSKKYKNAFKNLNQINECYKYLKLNEYHRSGLMKPEKTLDILFPVKQKSE